MNLEDCWNKWSLLDITPPMLSRFFAVGALCCAGIVAGCSPDSSVGAPAQAADAPATARADSSAVAKLTIKVTDLRSHKGQLIFGVFKTADGFPSDPKKAMNWQVKTANADTVTFTCELPAGKYGASVLHDENGNNKMDTNLIGIPTEGYGETNNPKPKFRAATYKESIFTLPSDGAEHTISIQYF